MSEIKVKLMAMTPNPLGVLKKAAGKCHDKGDVSDAVIQHIIKAGHLSVLEHCIATFEIECSTSVLLQLTRHRHFSFTVQSSRVCEMDKTFTSGTFLVDEATEACMRTYKHLLSLGVAKETAAYVLPKAAMYKVVVTGNFRTWLEYLPKRICKRALPEHQELAYEIAKQLVIACPQVFTHLTSNCKTCNEKGCDFK